MRITLGPIVQGAAGKLGNQIFSKWKNQPYVKQMPLGVRNPSTADQSFIRTLMDNLANTWDGLSAMQKALWEIVGASAPYVAQPETGIRAIIPVTKAKQSGINAFIGFNVKARAAGAVVDILTPAMHEPALAFPITAACVAGTLTVSWVDPGAGLTEFAVIWIYDKQRIVHKQLIGNALVNDETFAMTSAKGFDGTDILLTALVGNRFLVQAQTVNRDAGTRSAPSNTVEVLIA